MNTQSFNRGRGRPRKPTHKTPASIGEFDAIAAGIAALPKTKAARAKAATEARALVGNDKRLSRSAVVVFDRLLDSLAWSDGWCRWSNSWLAEQCDLNITTVRRALADLRDAGHVLRRRRQNPDCSWYAQTTIPVLLNHEGVGVKKSSDAAENSGVGVKKSGEGVGANKPQEVVREELSIEAPPSKRVYPLDRVDDRARYPTTDIRLSATTKCLGVA
jgi:hypothetical protein